MKCSRLPFPAVVRSCPPGATPDPANRRPAAPRNSRRGHNAWRMLGALLAVLLAPAFARASGTVTNCADAQNFLAALAGGGNVTFACEDDATITLTNTITITNHTVIDGGELPVVLDGNGNVRLFIVASNASLTLLNLSLTGGRSTNGGAIVNRGTVLASNCTFLGNVALGSNGLAGAQGKNDSTSGGDGGNGRNGNPGLGGAIYNQGFLTLLQCTFRTNSATGGDGGDGGEGGDGAWSGGDGGDGGNGATGYGGAIYNLGTAWLTDCTLVGNTAFGGWGGAMGMGGSGAGAGLPGDGGTGAIGAGAGLYNLGRATVMNCTFADNFGRGGDSAAAGVHETGYGLDGADGGNALGGAICNLGTNALVNCTFSTNVVEGGAGADGGVPLGGLSGGDGGNGGYALGGAFYNAALANLTNCTFSGGGAVGGTNGVSGGSLGEDGDRGASRGGNLHRANGTLRLKNSIVAYAFAGNNSFGTITDAGQNISSDASLNLNPAISWNNTDPHLGELFDNGGSTETFNLLPESPAIDAADPAASPELDQRGVSRYGVGPDIGAFELAAALVQGQITLNGLPLPGVMVTAGGRTNFTDATGFYFLNAVHAGTNTVVPFLAGHEFDPPSLEVFVEGDVEGADFAAFRLFTLGGRVTVGTNGLGGVKISVADRSATSEANGDYTLPGLREGAYTVIPTAAGFVFMPPSVDVDLRSNATVNFSAVSTFYTLGGRITQEGFGVSNVTVTVGGATVQTDSNGIYRVTGLAADTYLVVPALTGYDFLPPVQSVELAGDNTNVSFQAQGRYLISGRITEGEIGLEGVRLVAGRFTNTLTDADGNFTLDHLPPGPHVVTPVLAGYFFSPTNRAVTLPPNAFGFEFSAVKVFTVRGRVTFNSEPLTNVQVRVGSRLALTDTNGNYELKGVLEGTNFITATRSGYGFYESPREVALNADAENIDFHAFIAVSLSGRVLESGVGVTNVLVTAGGRTNRTDSNGGYVLLNLPAGTNVTVTPSRAGYAFLPGTTNVTLTTNVTGVDFAAVGTLTVSGAVTNRSGAGVGGAIVTAGNRSGVSDGNGRYTVTNLSPDKTYTVQPVLTDHGFDPGNRTVTLTNGSRSDLNFTAIPLFSINGRVLEGTVPLSGAIVTAVTDYPRMTNVVVSGADGRYTFERIFAGTNTVTPVLAGFEFSPTGRVVVLNGTVNLPDFVGTRVFAIRGRVTESSVGLSNVTLIASNLTLAGSPQAVVMRTTDTNGNYELTGIRPGTNVVTPVLPGYVFVQTNRTVIVGPDAAGIDFSATGIFTIGGRVTSNGVGVLNVAVSAGNRQDLTDAEGFYTITGLGPRTYSVTPAQANRVFLPATRPITVGPSTNNVDFDSFALVGLRGRITEGSPSGPGLAGVTVTAVAATPPLTNRVVTDLNGNYNFLNGVPAAENTVVPSLAGFGFSPGALTLTLTTNTAGADFIASAQVTLTLQPEAGAMRVLGVGIPNRLYNIQAATNWNQVASNVFAPEWQTITSRTAGTNGRFEYLDSAPGNQRFRLFRTERP